MQQCGFVKGKGTVNAIYILRTTAERAIEIHKDLYMCDIDYTTAVDTIRHAELMKLLQALSVDGKDLRIIKKLLGNQQQQLIMTAHLATWWTSKERFIKDVYFTQTFFPV